jgi:predicted metal-binding protein
MDILNELRTKAHTFGASDAKIISTKSIAIEDDVIDFCKEPLCESYGQSINCPPHTMPPDRFRDIIAKYENAIIFKIDVSPEILMSEGQFNEFRKIYEIVTLLEVFAVEAGFSESNGFAAGSCKPVFCPEYECQALIDGESCRYPEIARPSMEAVGINVFELVRRVGWEIHKISKDRDPESIPSGVLVGMLLVG